MNHTEQERVALTDAELDAELEKLAEDVPDMPADFHDRWMQAVRAEAAEKTAPETETEREPEPRGRLVAMRKWTRVLSVAAVFVFLIGGTMIYRNSRKSLEEPAREQAPAAAVEAMAAAQAPAAALPRTTWQRTAWMYCSSIRRPGPATRSAAASMCLPSTPC